MISMSTPIKKNHRFIGKQNKGFCTDFAAHGLR